MRCSGRNNCSSFNLLAALPKILLSQSRLERAYKATALLGHKKQTGQSTQYMAVWLQCIIVHCKSVVLLASPKWLARFFSFQKLGSLCLISICKCMNKGWIHVITWTKYSCNTCKSPGSLTHMHIWRHDLTVGALHIVPTTRSLEQSKIVVTFDRISASERRFWESPSLSSWRWHIYNKMPNGCVSDKWRW